MLLQSLYCPLLCVQALLYRCSLAGLDLNRCYKRETPDIVLEVHLDPKRLIAGTVIAAVVSGAGSAESARGIQSRERGACPRWARIRVWIRREGGL